MSTLRSFKSLPDLLVAREPDLGGVARSTRGGEDLGPSWTKKGLRGRRNQCEDVQWSSYQKSSLSERNNWSGGESSSRSSRLYNYKAGGLASSKMYLCISHMYHQIYIFVSDKHMGQFLQDGKKWLFRVIFSLKSRALVWPNHSSV